MSLAIINAAPNHGSWDGATFSPQLLLALTQTPWVNNSEHRRHNKMPELAWWAWRQSQNRKQLDFGEPFARFATHASLQSSSGEYKQRAQLQNRRKKQEKIKGKKRNTPRKMTRRRWELFREEGLSSAGCWSDAIFAFLKFSSTFFVRPARSFLKPHFDSPAHYETHRRQNRVKKRWETLLGMHCRIFCFFSFSVFQRCWEWLTAAKACSIP